MARSFNGTSNYFTVSPGAFNGIAFGYGTIVCIFRFSAVDGQWREYFSSNDGTFYWGKNSSDILTGSWSGTRSDSTFIPVAGRWYCIIISKTAGGAGATRYNLFDYSTLTWATPQNGSANTADQATNLSTLYISSFQGGAEYFNGDIAAFGMFRQWVPTDAEAQGIGLHTSRLGWFAAHSRSERAAFWLLDQSASTIPVRDLTGGGANETGGSAPGVTSDGVPLLGYGAPVLLPASVSAPSQSLNPASDVATNSWTTDLLVGTNLYQAIDEDTASDSDYLISPLGAGSGSYYETGLEVGTDPVSSANHRVRYRYRRGGNETTGVTVSLRQGATEIASWTHSDIAAGSFTAAEQTLTGTQADAIVPSGGQYTDLRIRIAPSAVAAATPAKVGADRGSTQNLTSQASTPVDMAAAASITVGNYLIARVAVDNTGGGGAKPGLTISDPRSNTWMVVDPANSLADPGPASTGSAVYIAITRVTNAYTNGDDITFNWGTGNPAAKSIVIEEWSGMDSLVPVAVAAVGANGATTAFSIASGAATAIGQLVYFAFAAEGPSGDTFPTDADITRLTDLSTGSATATDNQTIRGAYRISTAAAATTWNGTLGTARDWAAIAVVFGKNLGTNVEISWANFAIPEATVTAASPAAIALSASPQTPTLSAGAGATPAAVALAPTLQAAQGSASASGTPAVVPLSANPQAPTPSAGAGATPAGVPLAASPQAPTMSAGAGATPAVVPLSVSPQAPTPSAGAGATPAVVPLSVSPQAPGVMVGVSALPAVVPLAVQPQAPTGSGGATTTQTVIPLSVTPQAPAASGGAKGEPAVIPLTVAPQAPSLSAGAGAVPPVVALSATPQTPGTTAGAGATPAVVPLTINITAPIAGAGAIGAPDRIQLRTRIPGFYPQPILDSDGNPILDSGGNPILDAAEAFISASSTATPAVLPLSVQAHAPNMAGGTGATATPGAISLQLHIPSFYNEALMDENGNPITDENGNPIWGIIAEASVFVSTGATPAVIPLAVQVHAPTGVGGASGIAQPSVVPLIVQITDPVGSASRTITTTVVPLVVQPQAPTLSAGAGAQPSVIPLAVVADNPTASGGSGANAAPAVIQLTVQPQAPILSGGATTILNAIQLAAQLDAPTLSAGAGATPALVALAASLATPGISAGAGAVPAVVALLAQMHEPTAIGSAPGTANPQAVELAAVLGVPSVRGDARVALSPITLAAVLGQATASGGTGGTAQPAVIPLLAAMQQPTGSGGGTAGPGVVQLAALLGTPTISASGVTTPPTIPLVTTVLAPNILAVTVVEPAVIPLAAQMHGPALSAGAGAQPGTIVLTPVIGQPASGASRIVTPDPIGLTVVMHVPGILTLNDLIQLLLRALPPVTAWSSSGVMTGWRSGLVHTGWSAAEPVA